jgi:hypothetical protein
MANSEVFDYVCEQIESRTSLDRLSARGTVRIALKQAGLDPAAVTPEQMAVVVERLLPAELASRDIRDGADICAALAARTRLVSAGERRETADAVFRRLGEAG